MAAFKIIGFEIFGTAEGRIERGELFNGAPRRRNRKDAVLRTGGDHQRPRRDEPEEIRHLGVAQNRREIVVDTVRDRADAGFVKIGIPADDGGRHPQIDGGEVCRDRAAAGDADTAEVFAVKFRQRDDIIEYALHFVDAEAADAAAGQKRLPGERRTVAAVALSVDVVIDPRFAKADDLRGGDEHAALHQLDGELFLIIPPLWTAEHIVDAQNVADAAAVAVEREHGGELARRSSGAEDIERHGEGRRDRQRQLRARVAAAVGSFQNRGRDRAARAVKAQIQNL